MGFCHLNKLILALVVISPPFSSLARRLSYIHYLNLVSILLHALLIISHNRWSLVLWRLNRSLNKLVRNLDDRNHSLMVLVVGTRWSMSSSRCRMEWRSSVRLGYFSTIDPVAVDRMQRYYLCSLAEPTFPMSKKKIPVYLDHLTYIEMRHTMACLCTIHGFGFPVVVKVSINIGVGNRLSRFMTVESLSSCQPNEINDAGI